MTPGRSRFEDIMMRLDVDADWLAGAIGISPQTLRVLRRNGVHRIVYANAIAYVLGITHQEVMEPEKGIKELPDDKIDFVF